MKCVKTNIVVDLAQQEKKTRISDSLDKRKSTLEKQYIHLRKETRMSDIFDNK